MAAAYEIKLSTDDLEIDPDGYVRVKDPKKAQEILNFLTDLPGGTRSTGKKPAPRVKVEM